MLRLTDSRALNGTCTLPIKLTLQYVLPFRILEMDEDGASSQKKKVQTVDHFGEMGFLQRWTWKY